MVAKTLHSLFRNIEIDVSGLQNPLIKGISCDSRLVKEGDLYFGVLGENFDGGSFWAEALSSGAAALVLGKSAFKRIPTEKRNLVVVVPEPVTFWMGEIASAFWEEPSSKMILVGVTGTNGKTTTTHLIEHLSQATGCSSALFGTLYNRWPNYSEASIQTTRSGDVLHSQLAKAVTSGAKVGAMEVSSHALAQRRVAGIKFSGAVFTNLTQDHLDYHLSMEKYFEAKALLFKEPLLNVDTPKTVVNIDNEWGAVLAERIKPICWRSSLNEENIQLKKPELYITNLEIVNKRFQGILHTPLSYGLFKSSLLGEFNLMNLLQAIGVLVQNGFELEELLKAAESFPGVPGRMEMIRLSETMDQLDLPMVLVDYAHTPDGLKNALIASRPFAKKNLICLFGCGGDRDRSKRSQMGLIASELADHLIVTSDNPRTEDPYQILNDIISPMPTTDQMIVEVDREKAIQLAIMDASSGDVVVIAGKGHEDYQIIGQEKKHFDDREIAKQVLQQKAEILLRS